MLLLSGCVLVKTVNGPNGTPAYSLRCGMNAQSCYEKAGELCPHGYTVLNEANGFAVAPTARGLVGGSQYELLIECR